MKLWTFKTRFFLVEAITSRDNLDTRHMDSELAAECHTKVRSGEWQCFCTEVRVTHRPTRKILAQEYLGQSIYVDPREFVDHRGMKGSCFADMVHAALAEARKQLPALRAELSSMDGRTRRRLPGSMSPKAL